MARYIDAVKAADIISEKMNIPLSDLVDVFAEIPTADVAEVKHGEWKYCRKDNIAVCKNCSYEHYLGEYHQYATNYCPNCGAKMDKERKENK